jgi:hypothetical protein
LLCSAPIQSPTAIAGISRATAPSPSPLAMAQTPGSGAWPLRTHQTSTTRAPELASATARQGGSPFGSRGTTSSGAFDISALRPATDLGLERRGTHAAQGGGATGLEQVSF